MSRYFSVLTGAGPDGALVYSLTSVHKSKFGRLAYYARAAKLFATRRFHTFEVEYTEAASGRVVTLSAVSAMAVRVDDLGGIFTGLTSREARLEDKSIQLLLLAAPAWLSLPCWFVSGWLGIHRLNGFLRRIEVTSYSCRPAIGAASHVEADGEWLGRLPVEVSLIPDALYILAPRN